MNIPFETIKLSPMKQKKLSSRIYEIMKAALAAAVLPVIFIYIMISKPDYAIMNSLAHVVLPVANAVGDVITWPVRAVGDVIENIHELSNLKEENQKLKEQLSVALQNKNNCDIVFLENQKLANELGIVKSIPRKTILADVVHDTTAFHHSTFFVNRGIKSGVEKGMAVMSLEGALVGVVIDVAPEFSKIKSLIDSSSNIAVRVAGSEIYGFLRGNGSFVPTMGFFSDPEFKPYAGLRLITSNISGVLPDGIFVGKMLNETDVDVVNPAKISSVIILEFDANNSYK